MIQGIGNQLPPPSPASGFAAYKLTRTRIVQGEQVTTVAYVSTVWVQREGQLICIFRQETVEAQ
jgi:hypothetical protein